MAINFPDAPTPGQQHTVGNTTWTYSATKGWQATIAGSGAPHTHPVDDLTDASANAKSFLQSATYATMAGLLGLSAFVSKVIGVAANNVVALDGTAKLPAVDGSQLLNTPGKETILKLQESVGTGATYTISSATITRAYKRFDILFESVSHNNGANQNFRIELSGDNGSTWSTAANTSASVSAATTNEIHVTVFNAFVSTGNRLASSKHINGGQISIHSVTTGYVNAIRYSPSAGSFDDGLVTLIAYD
jgi:hypothetical protein